MFDGAHPQLFSGLAIEGQQAALRPLFIESARNEHMIAGNDWAAVSWPGERRLPTDVLVRPPLARRTIGSGYTIGRRSAELIPIRGGRESDGQKTHPDNDQRV
jgi:hypothetical protein